MNILHLSRTMGNGGAEKIVYQLSTDLTDTTDEVVVASTGGILVDRLQQEGIKHYQILDMESKSPKVIIHNLKQIYRIIKQHNIEIVHSHHRMAAFYMKILKCFVPNLKHVYTAHGIFLDKLLIYKYAVSSSINIAVGQSVFKNLKEDVKVKSVELIYNGINNIPTDQLIGDIINVTGVKIGCVARLSKIKGIEYLIEAMSLVKNEDSKLFIIGDGEEEEDLKSQVKTLNLQDRIYFLGYQENVMAYINSLDFLVLPSLSEGLPLSIIECFLSKKTVIGTNVEGIKDIITEKNGILVPSKNSKALANAIDVLTQDTDLRNQLAQQAYQDYLNNYTYEQFLDKYRKVYQNI